MKLSDLKPNEGQIEGVPSNPRTITEDDFEKLKKSLVNFRKMLSLRPMVVDEDWNILGGNMRYQALCRLRDEGVDGFTDDIPDEWVKQDTTLSAAEKREFVIKDNQQRGRNDWDALAHSCWLLGTKCKQNEQTQKTALKRTNETKIIKCITNAQKRLKTKI